MNASDAVTAAGDSLRGRRVLITGGSGFIGCRLAERLALRHGAEVRVLVRDVGRALRVATLPVELVRGSILDPVAVEAAVRGCDTVFHCAYGTAGSQGERSRTNLDGTRQVLEASGGGRPPDHRFVDPHGLRGPATATSTRPRPGAASATPTPTASWPPSGSGPRRLASPRRAGGGAPADRGLRTVGWGVDRAGLRPLEARRLILVDGGRGLANVVYVDDLVSAMLLAADRDEAVGEAFLISGAESEPWSVFYRRFAAMLPGDPTNVSSNGRATRRSPTGAGTAGACRHWPER